MTPEQRHTDRGPQARGSAWVFAGNAIQLFERHPVIVGLVVLIVPALISVIVSMLLSLGFVPGQTPSARMDEIERRVAMNRLDMALGDSLLGRRVDSVANVMRMTDSTDRPILRAVAADLCIRLSDEVLSFSELKCERRFRSRNSREP
jgi:hypothetical protein